MSSQSFRLLDDVSQIQQDNDGNGKSHKPKNNAFHDMALLFSKEPMPQKGFRSLFQVFVGDGFLRNAGFFGGELVGEV
jgi:hypothetical protein